MVTEAPYNTEFYTWMGKKHFCFFQTAETRNRTPDSSVKGSGANHYPRAPSRQSLMNGAETDCQIRCFNMSLDALSVLDEWRSYRLSHSVFQHVAGCHVSLW